MKNLVFCCMILMVFIIACEKTTSPGIESKIFGTILDPDGNPVADAKILVNFNIDSEYPIKRENCILVNNNNAIKDTVDPGPQDPPSSIMGNFPNPFTSTTIIVFQLGTYCTISVSIEDNFDNEVKTIIDNQLYPVGENLATWNGKNNENNVIQNGAYKILLLAEEELYEDTLFIFKDYNEFSYEDIAPLCMSDNSGEFTIQSVDLPLNYVGEQYDEEGCTYSDFSVTPYIDIWAFHPNYDAVHVDSILVESGKDIHVSLSFE